MKNVILIIVLSLLSTVMKAQLFSGGGGAITNDGQNTYFTIPVSGLSQAQIDENLGILEVCLSIQHPHVEELYIYLMSPEGMMVELTSGSSCSGSDYSGTCFDNSAASSVTVASAPYSGSYRPIGYLGRFNNGQAGNGNWTLIVQDYLAFVDEGSLLNWNISFGPSAPKPIVFTSSNLPLVILNTNGQPLSDSDILVGMGIMDNGPGQRNYVNGIWNNYDAKALVHIRGQSTKYFEKKSFSLQTMDASGVKLNASLLGMPAENDWDLLAPYQDKSLMRIPLTYDLYRQMGHYAARFRNVELVLNGEYMGIYELTEKPKRDKNRIDVAKLTTTENNYPEITGGYILKIDKSDVPGWSSLLAGDSPTNSHFYYEYVYPKDSDITVQQKTYIQNFTDGLENLINSPSYADPHTGYQKYFDLGSLIDFFIINELSRNVDAYRLSTYLYKDNISKGGKLHVGPVWDYDIAWHNCNYGNSFDPTGWEYVLPDTLHPKPTWWGRFALDSNFVDAVYCRWHQLRQGILDINNLNHYIDSSAAILDEAQQRNFIQWPVLGTYIYPNPQIQSNENYAAEVGDLKWWIASRIAWMDGAIYGYCQDPSGIPADVPRHQPMLFPNPFCSSIVATYEMNESAHVRFEFFNALGSPVLQMDEGNKEPGLYEEKINTEKLSKGMYLVKVTIGTSTSRMKLIK